MLEKKITIDLSEVTEGGMVQVRTKTAEVIATLGKLNKETKWH